MRIALLLVAATGLAFAQKPVVVDGGVLNGASFAKGQAVAPGSLVSIFGTELAATTAQAGSIPLSTSINDVSVTFNGVAAPLSLISPGQINAQVPWQAAPGQMTAVVTRGG